MKKKYYLAYGSNLNMDQMAWRCPDATPVGTAMLDGWQLAYKGSKTGSYLTVVPCAGSVVPVGVWQISAADERELDRYEGYPDFYGKQTVRVKMKTVGGRTRWVSALIYIMGDDRPFGFPSPYYVRTCSMGYRHFGLDISFLRDALVFTKKEVRSA